jgi:hypothetical protein
MPEGMSVEVCPVHVIEIEQPLVMVVALSAKIVRLQIGCADVVVVKSQITNTFVQVRNSAVVQITTVGVTVDVVFPCAHQKH